MHVIDICWSARDDYAKREVSELRERVVRLEVKVDELSKRVESFSS